MKQLSSSRFSTPLGAQTARHVRALKRVARVTASTAAALTLAPFVVMIVFIAAHRAPSVTVGNALAIVHLRALLAKPVVAVAPAMVEQRWYEDDDHSHHNAL